MNDNRGGRYIKFINSRTYNNNNLCAYRNITASTAKIYIVWWRAENTMLEISWFSRIANRLKTSSVWKIIGVKIGTPPNINIKITFLESKLPDSSTAKWYWAINKNNISAKIGEITHTYKYNKDVAV